MKKLLLSVLASTALLAVGCGNSTNLIPPVAPAQAQGTTQTQVEFLARPGIGEALLFSNDLLNTYNAVTPRFVSAALSDPQSQAGQAAAPVFNQAIAVLDILTGLDPNNGPTTTEVVQGFLPDVMRIDTTLNVAVGDTAYTAGAFNANGSLVGGRKLTDDVVDITLVTLTGGVVAGDGVPYYRPANNTNAAIGHSFLNGQNAEFGPATFPFLAPPN
jgi:hypothetical protein